MSLLDKLTIKDLDNDQRTLAECIGIDAYKKLLENYAGSFVYVRKPEMITNSIRNSCIKKEFNGCNIHELAKKYNLSVTSIRRIVLKPVHAKNKSDSPPKIQS